MGRRYYCDYCDKSFIDDLGARRKHLQSSHHIRLRNIHYELNRGKEVTDVLHYSFYKKNAEVWGRLLCFESDCELFVKQTSTVMSQKFYRLK